MSKDRSLREQLGKKRIRSVDADPIEFLPTTGLRARIAAAAISDNAKHDLVLLLGVAAGLLDLQASGIDSESRRRLSNR